MRSNFTEKQYRQEELDKRMKKAMDKRARDSAEEVKVIQPKIRDPVVDKAKEIIKEDQQRKKMFK